MRGVKRERGCVILKVVLCERVVIAVSAYRLFFSSLPKKRKSHVLKIPFNGNQSLNISIALFYYSADSQAFAARLTAEEKKKNPRASTHFLAGAGTRLQPAILQGLVWHMKYLVDSFSIPLPPSPLPSPPSKT